MGKRWLMMLAMLFVIPGLMFTASCSKKKIKAEEAGYEDQLPARATRDSDQARIARKRAMEDERLRQERLRKEREENLRRQKKRSVSTGSRRQFMEDDIHFSYDSASLTSEAQGVLRQKAEWLRSNTNSSVIIEGHCDERGTNAYNMALGDRRAESVKSFLANLGVSPSRLTTISYGEERPLDPRHNEMAWAKNRRAHFVLE
ncbi:peptidoglycan-associated lipoprotein Pal [Desulfococcaceae bacterium HSG8]|nr:peptidoglycan-associated lipoprotein Pal [Desulfococcaceae bacterium HSG8]